MDSSDQVADFIAFTCGASTEEAAKFLSLTNFNVEEAVHLYFSDQQVKQEQQGGQNQTDEALRRSTIRKNDEEEVRGAIPAKRQRLYGSSSSGLLLPGADQSAREKPVTSVFAKGGGKKTEKQEMLAKMYAPPFDIMFNGTFEELRALAKERDKWVLINIQKDEEFSAHVLNRDVWSNDSVKEVIKYGFIFWQKMDTSESAMKFLQSYQIPTNDSTFPLVAIVDPITNMLIKILKNYLNIPELLADFVAESNSPKEYWKAKNEVSLSSNMPQNPPSLTEACNESSHTADVNPRNVETSRSTKDGFDAQEVLTEIEEIEKMNSLGHSEDASKPCNIQVVSPSGKKYKESFACGIKTIFASLIKRVLDRLPEMNQKRFDLLYGFPPKSLSKLIDISLSDGRKARRYLLEKSFEELGLNNETITVRQF